MRRAGAIAVLPLVAIFLLLSPVAGALPSDVLLVADDAYSKEVPTGGEATFVWTLVNVNDTAAYALTATATITSPDYGIEVIPASASLEPRGSVRIVANVTVPVTPEAPRADIEVVVVLDGGGSTVLQATVIAQSELQLVSLLTAFLAVGAIIFIGFFASLFFERTKVPDLIWLIFLGLFLGPVLATFFGVFLIPGDLLRIATPYFAALALMIILFDGGLNLNFKQVIARAGVSLLQTLVTFSGTVFVVTLITTILLGYPFWVGVLLGAIIGGTSGAVVIGIVRGMSISEETRTILVLESTITDVLCIIGALTVIGILQGGGTLEDTIGGLMSAFSVALFLGFVTGLLWLRVLSALQGKPFGFMITIATLFILYAGTEWLGGSGGMAALIFGLVLGNHEEIGRALRMKEAFRIDGAFKQFDSEISFGIRTFFFVFLGFSFTFPFAADWEVQTSVPVLSVLNDTFWLILVAILLMFVGIYVVRVGAASMTVALTTRSRADRSALSVVMGRGLAAAVLASLPFAIPPFTDPSHPDYLTYRSLMAPYELHFLTVAFLIILLTVIATTIGVVSGERRRTPSDFGTAATQVLKREMDVRTRESARDIARKEREDRIRRRKELKRIERELRRKRS